MPESNKECVVSPRLSALIRVTRLAGIAPLHVVRAGGECRISFSVCWTVYGCLMITVINVITVLALTFELQLTDDHRLRMRTRTQRMVWTVQVVFMVLASGSAVYTAPYLMRSMIPCFNQMKKINLELNIHHWPKCWGKNVICLMGFQFILCVSLSLMNYLQVIICGIQLNQETWINALQICYFTSYWILQIRDLQFIAFVLHVKYSFVAVNKNFKSMLQDLDQVQTMTLSKEMINVIHKCKRLSDYVNTLDDLGNTDSGIVDAMYKSDHVAVKRLALVFAALCDVVRIVNDSQGPMVLIMLANFYLHLICTPYFFIIYLIDNDSVEDSISFAAAKLLIELLWCLYHTFNLVTIVEPCHLTHMEMVKTKELISNLLRYPRSSADPLAIELNQFLRYMILNKVSYEPLRIIKITRTLIFTLLGSITTYTVLILHL